MNGTPHAPAQRVFLTGATGCVGQQVLNALVETGCFNVHALVRPGANLGRQERVVVHLGSLETITDHLRAVRACHAIVHIAAAWDDSAKADEINVERTMDLLAAHDPMRCRRMIVYSTASVIGPDHALLADAATYGTAYIRSKHRAFQRLDAAPFRDRLTIVCPTLVIGGGVSYRPSHVVREVQRRRRLLWWAPFVRAEGRFHFIHAWDLAALTVRLLEHPAPPPTVVAGQPGTSFDDALRALAGLAGRRHRGWITLTPDRVLAACRLGRVRLSPWDIQNITHPYYDYRVTTPEDLGTRSRFPTIDAALRDVLPAWRGR